MNKTELDFLSGISEWNTIAGNEFGSGIDIELEKALVTEEFNEYISALETKDLQEMQDGFIDIMVVIAGTFHKGGLNISKTLTTMQNILDSNMSKFTIDENGKHICTKNEAGKIQKGPNFKQPDMSHLEGIKLKYKN